MHIFDVDHTITKGSTGRHYIHTAIELGVVPSRVLLSLPVIYLRYRLGKLKSRHINREFPQLEGMERSVLEMVAQRTFEERIRPDIYPAALDFIRFIRAEDTDVVLATSSFDIIIKPLAEYLGVREVIASSLEFVDGRCTGRFIKPPTFSQEKKNRVMEFLAERKTEPKECTFYSDSIYDLPLMESVGRPVAVNPDIMLARHARLAGWQILRFRQHNQVSANRSR